MNKIKILIAGDHNMLREGLSVLLDSQPGMHVVGEATNGRELLVKASQLKPDVVVMDLSMPELNGLQATRLLRKQNPPTKVVVLADHDDESYLSELCKAGAMGYVLKRPPAAELVQAIGSAAKGQVYFDRALSYKALNRQGASATGDPIAANAVLSAREKEVLILVAWGLSNKEVASELNVSVKTVETYKVRIAEKLGLQRRAHIVKYALQQGWLNEAEAPGSQAR
jgi:DNA-binding NarL/FixJ family response regulator